MALSPALHGAHRGTICLEEGTLLDREQWPGAQYVLRIAAPRCAARATPGSFVHLTCDEDIPMRRPLSIMRASRGGGWIDVLFKIVGPGLAALARRKVGDRISVLGPIGRGFAPDAARPRALLIGGGVGIPPMIYLAETFVEQNAAGGARWQPLVLMGSEIPFPFRSRPSTIVVPNLPDGVIACMPLLDGWGVPSRLASRSGYPGCFDGMVTELAASWLQHLTPEQLTAVAIYACGPTAMLEATARLAERYALPCQVALEEFMACAVGGCAGCAVRVQTPQGPAMKRVCVDGPVFDASSVFGAVSRS
ncbi:MAG: dihydroorotate dehydrogenase electron transfer subunit [Steroidobacteraceae bacterium]|nr:dihydroorotate dehydrogenase electron transfer subunit [Steroidobacteraceae bacterium]MDW8260711.1 dihydroorotate dehydrogenase electron transfer subunit [Gammaproteobacteria bacterium]